MKGCKPLAQPPKLEDHLFVGYLRLLIKYVIQFAEY
jgi:hypothetical protein